MRILATLLHGPIVAEARHWWQHPYFDDAAHRRRHLLRQVSLHSSMLLCSAQLVDAFFEKSEIILEQYYAAVREPCVAIAGVLALIVTYLDDADRREIHHKLGEHDALLLRRAKRRAAQ